MLHQVNSYIGRLLNGELWTVRTSVLLIGIVSTNCLIGRKAACKHLTNWIMWFSFISPNGNDKDNDCNITDISGDNKQN